MKKIFALLIAAVTVLTLLPVSAFADSVSISESGTYDISTFGDNTVLTIDGGLDVTLTNNDNLIMDNFRIICSGGNTYLKVMHIVITSGMDQGHPALSFSGIGNTLEVIGDSNNFCSVYSQDAAGIYIADDAELTITGPGTVYAEGGENAAGIGGNNLGCGGSITIDGAELSVAAWGGDGAAGIGCGEGRFSGDITIRGGAYVLSYGGTSGAGIGGGDLYANENNPASGELISLFTLTIEGEDTEVVAEGGDEGSGLGGGNSINDTGDTMLPKKITIIDATVEASGGENYGAGIGGGDESTGGTIYIQGGDITATGGYDAAGIGGGYGGYMGDITIINSLVSAFGGDCGAGIGGGVYATGGTIYIQGGNITAQGGDKGAGIGGGDCGYMGDITIINSTVNANGGFYGSGIGGGDYSYGGNIIIESSDITAQGGEYGAGIGGGDEHETFYMEISDSHIIASGGENCAGIGSGDDSEGFTLKINGCDIEAQGGKYGAGIGGGGSDSSGADWGIHISDSIINSAGGEGAAGIGGGSGDYDGSIYLQNSEITAQGGIEAAGIGSGSCGKSDDIIIVDCEIVSRGGEGAAGIGAGEDAYNISISISGGNVQAYGGDGGAGIGGGHATSNSDITISGGIVYAKAGLGGAGIGSGSNSESGTITISGGLIFAEGSEDGRDLGDGDGATGSAAPIIYGISEVFLKNDTCTQPFTQHSHFDMTDADDDGYLMGAFLPDGWDSAGGYYHGLLQISYNANGGKGDPPETTEIFDNPYAQTKIADGSSLTFPRREFICWNSDPLGEGTQYIPGSYHHLEDGATLYAQWSTIEVSSLIIIPETLAVSHRRDARLTADILPIDADDKTVTWHSDAPSVAAVDASGLVSGIALGKTVITATSGTVSCKCSVTVQKLAVEKVIPSRSMVTLSRLEQFDLSAQVQPYDATYPGITWTSTNESVAKVVNGTVIATGAGTCSIIAAADGVSASCIVTVLKKSVASVSLDTVSKSLYVGDWFTLSASVSPSDATFTDITWTSSDVSVATVSQVGVVQAISDGECQITATADGVSASCDVSVGTKSVTDVALNHSSKTLHIGEMFALTAYVTPDYAADPSVTWKSSDSNIAKVTDAGIVEAKAAGSCSITATAGTKSASCTITVQEAPEVAVDSVKLAINSNTVTILYVGDTVDLVANVIPSDADDKSLTWSSSDTSIATVSAQGHVAAVAAGDATITVSAGGHSDAYNISVRIRDGDAPAPTPVPSPAPSDAQPSSTQVREVTIIDFDTANLPDGTKYILLPCGDILELNGEDVIRIKVPCEDVDGDGNIEFVALNDERVPLGSVDVAAAGVNKDAGGMSAWVIVLIAMGILIAGVGGTLVFIKLSVEKR